MLWLVVLSWLDGLQCGGCGETSSTEVYLWHHGADFHQYGPLGISSGCWKSTTIWGARLAARDVMLSCEDCEDPCFEADVSAKETLQLGCDRLVWHREQHHRDHFCCRVVNSVWRLTGWYCRNLYCELYEFGVSGYAQDVHHSSLARGDQRSLFFLVDLDTNMAPRLVLKLAAYKVRGQLGPGKLALRCRMYCSCASSELYVSYMTPKILLSRDYEIIYDMYCLVFRPSNLFDLSWIFREIFGLPSKESACGWEASSAGLTDTGMPLIVQLLECLSSNSWWRLRCL